MVVVASRSGFPAALSFILVPFIRHAHSVSLDDRSLQQDSSGVNTSHAHGRVHSGRQSHGHGLLRHEGLEAKASRGGEFDGREHAAAAAVRQEAPPPWILLPQQLPSLRLSLNLLREARPQTTPIPGGVVPIINATNETHKIGATDPLAVCLPLKENDPCGLYADSMIVQKHQENQKVAGKCRTFDLGGEHHKVCVALDWWACEGSSFNDTCSVNISCPQFVQAPCEGRCIESPGLPFRHICSVPSPNAHGYTDLSMSTTACEENAEEGSECAHAEVNGVPVPGKCKSIALPSGGQSVLCFAAELFQCEKAEFGAPCMLDAACPHGNGSDACHGTCEPAREHTAFDRECQIPKRAPGDAPLAVSVCTGMVNGEDCGMEAEFDGNTVPGKCRVFIQEGKTVAVCVPKDLFACEGLGDDDPCDMDALCPPDSVSPCTGQCKPSGHGALFRRLCTVLHGPGRGTDHAQATTPAHGSSGTTELAHRILQHLPGAAHSTTPLLVPLILLAGVLR
eukprot:TRINITY_DN72977_c0_g1_i1.p1 TRINITY_DN72977_c0_g1~~TRINITY_DN72977_c0_g1_i1.p1  ORF type:complete len:509 (+),score=54.29 TRINITY_DN72977_c0_g1_i1:77-1603(+)